MTCESANENRSIVFGRSVAAQLINNVDTHFSYKGREHIQFSQLLNLYLQSINCETPCITHTSNTPTPLCLYTSANCSNGSRNRLCNEESHDNDISNTDIR